MTRNSAFSFLLSANFNPHEREARDRRSSNSRAAINDFNPHEREARDVFRAELVGELAGF